MMHPDSELQWINDTIGYGVVATAPIPRGTVVWVLDELDQRFTPKKWHGMPEPYRPILDKYSYLDGSGNYILCWDHGRLVNHSCEATMFSAGWHDFEVA